MCKLYNLFHKLCNSYWDRSIHLKFVEIPGENIRIENEPGNRSNSKFILSQYI